MLQHRTQKDARYHLNLRQKTHTLFRLTRGNGFDYGIPIRTQSPKRLGDDFFSAWVRCLQPMTPLSVTSFTEYSFPSMPLRLQISIAFFYAVVKGFFANRLTGKCRCCPLRIVDCLNDVFVFVKINPQGNLGGGYHFPLGRM